MTPGIHPSLTMADYLAAPAVSASIVRTITERCPRAAWFESWLNPLFRAPVDDASADAPVDDANDASDLGSIAHGILLEGSTANVEVIEPMDHPAKSTGAIPSGWTNASIRAARDAARAAGKTPILAPKMARVSAIVNSAREFIESLRHAEPAVWRAFQPGGGDSELTMVWDDDGTLCRLRADRISADRAIIVDAKFTGMSAEPGAWGRSQFARMGYYVSAAFYRRGVRAVCNVEPEYAFLVVETQPPYLCSLVGVDPAAFALGAQRVERGLALWRQCVAANRWPGYPARAAYPEIPAYEYARWQGDEVDAQGIPYDVSKLFRSKEATP